MTHTPFLAFLVLWATITTFLTWWSGWFATERKFPDRSDHPLLTFRGQSGSMNGVNLNSMLQLAPCRSGLRIRALKLFFPLAKAIFVPWEQISMRNKNFLIFKKVELSFGTPPVSRLTIDAAVADRLSRVVADFNAAGASLPSVDAKALARERFIAWLLQTSFVSAFFIVVPRLDGSVGPPVPVAVLFPALMLGFSHLIRYWALIKNDGKS